MQSNNYVSKKKDETDDQLKKFPAVSDIFFLNRIIKI